MDDPLPTLSPSDLPPFLRRHQDGDILRPKSVHVIINPAAGQEQPILSVLNQTFKAGGIDWEAFITKEQGDARRYARSSAMLGVDLVMACGGDGTVTETASGLRDTGVPLAILPFGSANVMSLELGIPRDLGEAAAFVIEGRGALRTVDMGTTGEHDFLLRLGAGLEAKIINETPRELKNRWGSLAYVINGINNLTTQQTARYSITVDGKAYEEEGITLYVANSANAGLPGVNFVPNVDVSDGLLDVILIRRSNLPALLAIATNALLNRAEDPEPVLRWQAREVTVRADPPQPVEVDGELGPDLPFTVTVIPKAIQIVCPVPEA
jgi:YegS/Rv2252/BmrU family lipid kinase